MVFEDGHGPRHTVPPDADFSWEDHEEPECSPTSKLSEETESILNMAMTAPLSTTERRKIRGRYPIPATTLTRTPKVDEIFTSSESRFPKNTDTKAIEKDLSHISTCTLDAARPLLDLIEGVNSGEFTLEDVKIKAVDTLRLLGNTVAHTSTIRRKCILKVCNPDIVSLADNRELFNDAAPSLFGKGFETKMEDRAEALKVLHRVRVPHNIRERIFFEGAVPQPTPQEEAAMDTAGDEGATDIPHTIGRHMPQSRQSRQTRTVGRTEFELKRPAWQQFNTKAFQYYSNKKCFRFYQNQTGVQKGSIRGTQKLPISRKTATFSPQLGETNSGPMCPTNSEGCSNRIYKHTSPILFPIQTQSVREREGIITGGDHLHDGEGGNSGAITGRNPHGFLFHSVSGPQERWENETSDQPKVVKPVCTGTSFQNGRHSDSQRTSPAKRLVNEDRPKGCLFYDTNSQGTPEISQVQGGSSLLPVHMPTVRSVERSLGLYQDMSIWCTGLI